MATKAINNLPVQDIIEWDVPNWSQLITYWQPALEQLPRDSKILAIGERNGGLSLWLALMGFHVVCTDIDDISERAQQLHLKYNVADKVEYKIFDIVNDQWQPGEFDIIIAKSVIGGLKSERSDAATRSFSVQQKAVDNIYQLLKPGGLFFSAENMLGNIMTRLMRKAGKRSSGWRYLAYNELQQLFSRYTLVQTKTFGILPTFFSLLVYNRTAYFINKYILQFLPAGTKYIAFTIAQK